MQQPCDAVFWEDSDDARWRGPISSDEEGKKEIEEGCENDKNKKETQEKVVSRSLRQARGCVQRSLTAAFGGRRPPGPRCRGCEAWLAGLFVRRSLCSTTLPKHVGRRIIAGS